jgi:hypothetical protein
MTTSTGFHKPTQSARMSFFRLCATSCLDNVDACPRAFTVGWDLKRMVAVVRLAKRCLRFPDMAAAQACPRRRVWTGGLTYFMTSAMANAM